MNRIVNFDDNRNKLELVISGEKFIIYRITHNIIAEYGDYMKASGLYMQAVAALTKVIDSKQSTKEEIKEAETALQNEIIRFSELQAKSVFSILEKIMVKNGYEYSNQWWLDNASFKEIENFVLECLNKDAPADKKKAGKAIV